MAQDLRSYLDLIKRKKPEEFVIVSREMDPAYEITALVVKLEKEARRRPVLLFEKVKGTPFPVLTNLHAGRSIPADAPPRTRATDRFGVLALLVAVSPLPILRPAQRLKGSSRR